MKDLRLHDLDGRRNGSDLETRLRGLASDLVENVAAPPFDDVREAIGRRSRVLRRRRDARRVAAGGLLAATAAVAVVTLRPVQPDVQVGPAGDGSGATMAALTLDLDGWTLERAEEHDDVADLPGTDSAVREAIGEAADEAADEATVQVFRLRGRLDGPIVHLRHRFATDAVGAAAGGEQVDIDGVPGYVTEVGGTVRLRWNPASTDSEADITALGLDEGEVVSFARSLVPIDDAAALDARSTGGRTPLGFVVGSPPRGLEEVGLAPGRGPVDVRRSWFVLRGDGADGAVEIQVDDRGEQAFEMTLYDPTEPAAWSGSEQLTVLGRPALLQPRSDGRWVLRWRHAEDTWVTVTIGADSDGDDEVDPPARNVDRATVDQIVAHLREISEPSWQDALDAASAG
jgi:hypothetical protein